MLWLEDAGDVLQGMILLQFRTSLGVCGMASTSSCAAIFAKFNGVRMLFLCEQQKSEYLLIATHPKRIKHYRLISKTTNL